MLCSMIEEEQPREALIRKDVGIACPFPGSRSFVFGQPDNTCEETHSQLISNDTQLHFLYNQCHPSRETDLDSACEYDISFLQCHALEVMGASTWSCVLGGA